MDDTRLERLEASMSDLNHKFAEHCARDDELYPLLKQMIECWQQSLGVVKFVKWLFVVGGVVGTFIVWAKEHVKW